MIKQNGRMFAGKQMINGYHLRFFPFDQNYKRLTKQTNSELYFKIEQAIVYLYNSN